MKFGKIATAVALLIACSTVGTGAYTVVDTRNRVILTAQRLDQKIIQDKIDWLEFKLEELLQKYGSYDRMPESAKAWFRNLQKQLRDARAKQGGK